MPAVPLIPEGSMWQLGQADSTVVLTRNNLSPTLFIDDWIRRQGHDPWRGIEATVVTTPTTSNDHGALLPITTGQRITILGTSNLAMGYH